MLTLVSVTHSLPRAALDKPGVETISSWNRPEAAKPLKSARVTHHSPDSAVWGFILPHPDLFSGHNVFQGEEWNIYILYSKSLRKYRKVQVELQQLLPRWLYINKSVYSCETQFTHLLSVKNHIYLLCYMHLMHILFVNTSYLEYGHLAVHIELLFYASPGLDSWAKAMN